VAKEAVLARILTRPVSEDEGIKAGRMFQGLCWGKDLTVRIHGTDDNGKIATAILTEPGETVNEKLTSAGLARVAKGTAVVDMTGRMVDGTAVLKLAADLNVAQEVARKTRSGMWCNGDIGDEDPDEI
jgi:staphylococcal nuclease domain-containing protein 1